MAPGVFPLIPLTRAILGLNWSSLAVLVTLMGVLCGLSFLLRTYLNIMKTEFQRYAMKTVLKKVRRFLRGAMSSSGEGGDADSTYQETQSEKHDRYMHDDMSEVSDPELWHSLFHAAEAEVADESSRGVQTRGQSGH